MDIQPRGRPSLDELIAMRGGPVLTSEGKHVGDIDAVFYDEPAREPEWIGVRVEQGIFTELTGTHYVLVPYSGSYVDDDENLRIPYTSHEVRDAPRYDRDWEDLPEEVEPKLYDYYTLLTIERRRKEQLKAGAEEDMEEASIPPPEPAPSEQSMEQRTRARRLRRWVLAAPHEGMDRHDKGDSDIRAA